MHVTCLAVSMPMPVFDYRINGSFGLCDFCQQSILHLNFWIISAIQDGHFMQTVVLPPKISLLHSKSLASSNKSILSFLSSNQSFLAILFDDGNVYFIDGAGTQSTCGAHAGTQLSHLGFTGTEPHGTGFGCCGTHGCTGGRTV